MTITWPRYRRTAMGGNLYRIEARDRFTELHRLGWRWIIHVVRDAPYPEQVRIVEMLEDRDGLYLELDADVFEQALAEALAEGSGAR